MKGWFKFQWGRAKFQWCRMKCFVKDHEIAAMVKWDPEVVHMTIVCDCCGKALGHLHIPTARKQKERLH